MKSTKILSLISEIMLYAFAAIMLVLGILGLSMSDAINDFSMGLGMTVSMAWGGLAIYGAVSLTSVIMSLSERKKDTKFTLARAIIYIAVNAACITTYFIVSVLVLAIASIGREMTFIDEIFLLITVLPLALINAFACAACWTKALAMKQTTSDISLMDPTLKGKKKVKIVGSVIVTVLSIAIIAFVMIIGISLLA